MRRVFIFLFNLIFPKNDREIFLETLTSRNLLATCAKFNTINGLMSDFANTNSVRAIFSYRDKLIKEIIWQMKFCGNRKCAKLCGEILSGSLCEMCATEKFILLPIPIHKRRRSERGFNQCELMCEEIIKENKIIYEPNLLLRKIYKKKQSWGDKKDRVKNISGVFEINQKKFPENYVSGKSFILIDDVITTGATVNEARRLLTEAGAKKVLIFVFAH